MGWGRCVVIRTSVLGVALAVVVLGGCDDADRSLDTTPRDLAGTTAGGPAGTAVTTEGDATADSEPASAYLSWLQALQDHDAAGSCALHAPDFTIALRQQAILDHRARLGDPCTAFVAVLWEDPARRYDPKRVETTYETDEKATVAASFPGGDETVDLVQLDGSWRVLRTEARAEAGAGPARWLAAWCDLDPSMSRGELIAAMGQPSGEYTVSNGGEPQLWWAQDQYDFRAYLDADGSVLQLVGDYDALSAADRGRLTCPELRG